jgi:hypothetical protein
MRIEPPEFFDPDAAEEVTVTQDYFLVRRWGVVRDHSPSLWRSFHGGYRAIGDMHRTRFDLPASHQYVAT